MGRTKGSPNKVKNTKITPENAISTPLIEQVKASASAKLDSKDRARAVAKAHTISTLQAQIFELQCRLDDEIDALFGDRHPPTIPAPKAKRAPRSTMTQTTHPVFAPEQSADEGGLELD